MPEEQLTKKEIEELDELDTDLYDKPKSQSQRIRNTLFKLFEQDTEGYAEFKDYYKDKTDKIIEHLKSKIK